MPHSGGFAVSCCSGGGQYPCGCVTTAAHFCPRRFMKQNCFIVPVSQKNTEDDDPFSPLTVAPYRLGLSAEAVEAECRTAADIESKLEELEDMYQVRGSPRQMLVLGAAFGRGVSDSARALRTSRMKSVLVKRIYLMTTTASVCGLAVLVTATVLMDMCTRPAITVRANCVKIVHLEKSSDACDVAMAHPESRHSLPTSTTSKTPLHSTDTREENCQKICKQVLRLVVIAVLLDWSSQNDRSGHVSV